MGHGELEKIDLVRTNTSHFSHAGGSGIESILPDESPQHPRKLVLLIVTQGEIQDTVAGVAQTAVPKIVIDGNEGRFWQRQKDFRYPVVEDQFPRANLL